MTEPCDPSLLYHLSSSPSAPTSQRHFHHQQSHQTKNTTTPTPSPPTTTPHQTNTQSHTPHSTHPLLNSNSLQTSQSKHTTHNHTDSFNTNYHTNPNTQPQFLEPQKTQTKLYSFPKVLSLPRRHRPMNGSSPGPLILICVKIFGCP